MGNFQFISVLCPVYNEADSIENILSFFINVKISNKELLIIDGGSTDGTKKIVENWCSKYNNIKLVENPDRFVPFALNKGIIESRGDIIIRLDAHTEYAPDYIDKIIETFNDTDADIVGGPMNAVGKIDIQKAIAYATSTKLGIGDSKFHDINHKGYVDSVYLGAWKKSMFDEIGYFDEKMLRNQDDEFHYRAKSRGKKIYLNPEIISFYYPRKTLKSLCRQYYQYGLYKPLVLKKIKSEIKLRHIVPALFVIYLILSMILALIYMFESYALSLPYALCLIFIPLFLYFFLDIVFSLRAKGGFRVKIFTFFVYPFIHLSYGSGFIKGLIAT